MASRRLALAQLPGPGTANSSDPTAPVGHDRGVRSSVRLTQMFRQQKGILMEVTPQQVTKCLSDALVQPWALMGLHGYVGYLPRPRATQDVDVLVTYDDRELATAAIHVRWPELQILEYEQVVRFMDPNELDGDGKPMPVIDLMMPWSKFQETILEKYIYLDEETGHWLPTLEAAIVSKYAPLISPNRKIERKDLDAGDFRSIVKANAKKIDEHIVRELANQVWDGGGDEVVEFIALALQDQPFPTRCRFPITKHFQHNQFQIKADA